MLTAHFQRARTLGAVVLVFIAFTVSGCAKTGKVTGKVTFDGKTLKGGTVTFTPASGPAIPADISEDGSYTLNAPLGTCKITVDTAALDPSTVEAQHQEAMPPGLTPDQEKEYKQKHKEHEGDQTKIKEMTARYVEIPMIYADKDKSNQSYTVVKGSQTYEINLPKPADWTPGERIRKRNEMMMRGGKPQ